MDNELYFKWVLAIRLISEVYDYITITDYIYEKNKDNIIIITPNELLKAINKIKDDKISVTNFTYDIKYNERGVILIINKELLALISLYNLF